MKHHSKKWTAAALLLTVLTSTACGNAGSTEDTASAASDTKIKVSFYSYNLAIASQVPGTEKLIREFEEAHPNIDIDPIPVSSTDINSKVQADIVAGSTPDIAQITFDGLDFAVNNFNAKPLEDIVPADELASNFQGFSENGLKLGQLNGKTYGLPFTFSTPVLFYNADLFKKAGLDPEQPPKTWEKVKEYGLQIAKSSGASGVHVGGATGGDWIIQALIGSNGGRGPEDSAIRSA